MAFFGIVAVLLLLLAMIFFVPIMVGFIQTGLVPKFPTLIVCGFVVMASIQSLFAGLILQTMYQKNRQDFEMELYRVTKEFMKEQKDV